MCWAYFSTGNLDQNISEAAPDGGRIFNSYGHLPHASQDLEVPTGSSSNWNRWLSLAVAGLQHLLMMVSPLRSAWHRMALPWTGPKGPMRRRRRRKENVSKGLQIYWIVDPCDLMIHWNNQDWMRVLTYMFIIHRFHFSFGAEGWSKELGKTTRRPHIAGVRWSQDKTHGPELQSHEQSPFTTQREEAACK